MTFSMTPVTGFPPTTPDEFPQGLQFQYDGTNVGGRDIDTVNFVPGDGLSVTVGEGENANILTITIPIPNVSG